jgi:hypothetical protein
MLGEREDFKQRLGVINNNENDLRKGWGNCENVKLL